LRQEIKRGKKTPGGGGGGALVTVSRGRGVGSRGGKTWKTQKTGDIRRFGLQKRKKKKKKSLGGGEEGGLGVFLVGCGVVFSGPIKSDNPGGGKKKPGGEWGVGRGGPKNTGF